MVLACQTSTKPHRPEEVQMISLLSSYGIKFSSNWQTRIDKREVKDRAGIRQHGYRADQGV